ncbi:MAG: golvesin C-terminal-like domain-containing protein [Planctomycetota bacterium]|jgi:uncharacterized lipoprotein YddW (UPF0748 family)
MIAITFMLTLAVATAASATIIVVDNTDPGFGVVSGAAWSLAGYPDYTGQWDDDYRWRATSDPVSVVEWRPTIPAAGEYAVSIWYRSTGSGRPDDAHYTVYHDGGVDDVFVDQQIDGSRWLTLGRYQFAAGTTGRVTLTSDAQPSKNIVADAVRFRSIEPQQPAFRAFWADAFHPGFKSTAEIDALVSRAVAGNYNAIVPEVLAYQDTGISAHGAYWDSSIIPQASDIVGGLDPLAYLVQQAHAADIEVHAWLVTYRVCESWPPSGNSLVAAHPEWIMVPLADMGGGPAPVAGKYTLDPGSPDAQEYLINIVQELVSNYEIDGINWDYIRYVQTDAGYPADTSYTKSSLARFQQITGYAGTPPPTGEPSWNDFRRRTIDELIRRCRAEIAAITSNPSQPLCLSADLICFGNAPASFSNSSAYSLHQNWRLWMERGWLDAGMPMNYKREHSTSQPFWYRNWIDAAIGWRYDRHMYCGQATYLNHMANSLAQMQYALHSDADGTVNYSYYATADQDLDGNWETDWSWYTYLSDNQFTMSVPTPAMPWRDPAAAVEGTLWGQVIDATTDTTVDNATVQVGAMTPVETDGNGYYVVTLIPAATGGTSYDVTVTKDGYPTANLVDVVVMPGEAERRDVILCTSAGAGDMDSDCDIDSNDLVAFVFCMAGPAVPFPPGHFCLAGDADGDTDIDLSDFANFQKVYGAGSN